MFVGSLFGSAHILFLIIVQAFISDPGGLW
jgi:hypothetical protein